MKVTIEALGIAVDAITERLKERDPAGFHRNQAEGKGLVALLPLYPDLEAEFHAHLEALSKRVFVLSVKRGDWVTIDGWRFRVGAVRADCGWICTERIAVDGTVVSTDWARGEGLLPDTTAPTLDELDQWDSVSGRERIRRHSARLVAAGRAIE